MIHGVTILEGTPEWEWDSRSGYTSSRSWIGSELDILDYSMQLRALGVRHRVTQHSNRSQWLLTADYGPGDYVPGGGGATQDPDEPLSTVWNLVGGKIEKSIWSAPKVAVEMRKIPDVDARRNLRYWIETYIRDVNAVDLEGIAVTVERLTDLARIVSGATITTGFVSTLIELMLEGAESIPIGQYILRRAKTVAGNTTITADYTHVLEYMTTAELIAAESVPTFLLGALVDGIWVKDPPNTEQVSGTNKWMITHEWLHADSASALLWTHAT